MIRCERLAMSILSTAAIVLVCTWLGTPAVRAQEKPLREQLVGAWTLVSIEVTSRDGDKRPGLGGPNAKGILILDVSGRYAQVTGDPVRPKLTATARKDIPAAELGRRLGHSAPGTEPGRSMRRTER